MSQAHVGEAGRPPSPDGAATEADVVHLQTEVRRLSVTSITHGDNGAKVSIDGTPTSFADYHPVEVAENGRLLFADDPSGHDDVDPEINDTVLAETHTNGSGLEIVRWGVLPHPGPGDSLTILVSLLVSGVVDREDRQGVVLGGVFAARALRRPVHMKSPTLPEFAAGIPESRKPERHDIALVQMVCPDGDPHVKREVSVWGLVPKKDNGLPAQK